MPAQGTSDEYKNAYRKALGLLRPFDGICPSDCNKCEEREVLVLLPEEETFLPHERVSKALQSELTAVSGVKGPCPAHHPCVQGCAIYRHRPIDCRSFPIVPHFEADGTVGIRVSRSYCPIADSVPHGFADAVQAAWHLLAPHLPKEWKQKYNQIPCSE